MKRVWPRPCNKLPHERTRSCIASHAWRLWRWIRLTGAVPSRTGKDPVGHILAVKHERPDLYRATYKFLEPMDYLTFRLTGRATA